MIYAKLRFHKRWYVMKQYKLCETFYLYWIIQRTPDLSLSKLLELPPAPPHTFDWAHRHTASADSQYLSSTQPPSPYRTSSQAGSPQRPSRVAPLWPAAGSAPAASWLGREAEAGRLSRVRRAERPKWKNRSGALLGGLGWWSYTVIWRWGRSGLGKGGGQCRLPRLRWSPRGCFRCRDLCPLARRSRGVSADLRIVVEWSTHPYGSSWWSTEVHLKIDPSFQ